jgi:hypothetical protein
MIYISPGREIAAFVSAHAVETVDAENLQLRTWQDLGWRRFSYLPRSASFS